MAPPATRRTRRPAEPDGGALGMTRSSKRCGRRCCRCYRPWLFRSMAHTGSGLRWCNVYDGREKFLCGGP
uniref:Uncharacterized protein n=1 Tax=Kalanchoe fedtschenkoi TaxID=63787 RepID=A0A7N0VET5_KALFE